MNHFVFETSYFIIVQALLKEKNSWFVHPSWICMIWNELFGWLWWLCTWCDNSLHRAIQRKQHTGFSWHRSAQPCRTQMASAHRTDNISHLIIKPSQYTSHVYTTTTSAYGSQQHAAQSKWEILRHWNDIGDKMSQKKSIPFINHKSINCQLKAACSFLCHSRLICMIKSDYKKLCHISQEAEQASQLTGQQLVTWWVILNEVKGPT